MTQTIEPIVEDWQHDIIVAQLDPDYPRRQMVGLLDEGLEYVNNAVMDRHALVCVMLYALGSHLEQATVYWDWGKCFITRADLLWAAGPDQPNELRLAAMLWPNAPAALSPAELGLVYECADHQLRLAMIDCGLLDLPQIHLALHDSDADIRLAAIASYGFLLGEDELIDACYQVQTDDADVSVSLMAAACLKIWLQRRNTVNIPGSASRRQVVDDNELINLIDACDDDGARLIMIRNLADAGITSVLREFVNDGDSDIRLYLALVIGLDEVEIEYRDQYMLFFMRDTSPLIRAVSRFIYWNRLDDWDDAKYLTPGEFRLAEDYLSNIFLG